MKRVRAKFTLRIAQPQSVKTFFEMIHAVPINELAIQVEKSEDFTGMIVEKIDAKKTCLVNARYMCEVEGTDFPPMSVSLKDLLICLKGVAPHYVLEVDFDGEDVAIVARDAITRVKINNCILRTLSDDMDERLYLPEQSYDYIVQIDRHTLSKIINQASDLNADTLRFRIFTSTADDKQTIVFCLSADGTTVTKMEHYFPSVLDEDNIFIASVEGVDIDDELDEKNCVVNDAFCLPYLKNFIKSVTCAMIKLRMGRNDSPDGAPPLGVHCQVGCDGSYVSYALASKVE